MYRCLIILLFIPNIAWAQAAEPQLWWQDLLAHLLEIVITIATPAILLLARSFLKTLADKSGIEIAERQYVMLDEWVNKGVSYAHEQGRKALKEGDAMPSGDKKAAAVEFAASALTNLGLVDATRDQLEQLVEAKLNTRRDDPVQAGKFVVTNDGRPVADLADIAKHPPPVPKK